MINLIKKIIEPVLKAPKPENPFQQTLTDTVIVVTGGTKGIGKAISEVLTGEGATVIPLSRHALGENSIECDLNSESSVKHAVSEIIKRVGKIDVLINNAGIFNDKRLDETTTDDYESIMNTNVRGIYFMCREVIPFMKKQKSGFILNIGSKISHNTNVTPNKVLYATTKYAVEGFSYALNKELKPSGIRVTCLMPGTVDTFLSLKSKEYLSPFDVAYVICMMIKCKNIDFESVLMKSLRQNI